MGEVLAVLLALAFLLAIVTVVGHGVWVLIAKIFGGGGHRDASQQATKDWHDVGERPRDKRAALRLLRRQLDNFTFWGALDQETRDRLSAAVEAEEKRAIEPSQAVAAAAPSVEESIELTPIEPPPYARAEDAAAKHAAAFDAGAAVVEKSALHSPPEFTQGASAKPTDVPLGERARKFAASRMAAETAATTESPVMAAAASAKPAEPAVPMSRLFAAFMEENNIRWGELVGGLLIVGCSVALVISLWSQIAGRPLLQFVLFNGVTAALFGVGMYTDRRWKIHTTSRGLLVIATLLVPLNFLALAAFTQESPPSELLPMAGEVISLVVFTLLVYVAGRIVTPGDAVPLVVGVMVPSLTQLLVRRFAGPSISMTGLYSLAAVPVAAYLVSTGATLRRRWIGNVADDNRVESPQISGEALAEPVAPDVVQAGDGLEKMAVPIVESRVGDVEANRVLLFLGMVSAAAIMPLALLLYYTPPTRETLHWLSPLVTVCGLPALLVGLLFWRRVVGAENSGLQTAGIAVGALGAMVMCAGIFFAWPDPATLLPTAVVTAVAMLIVAFVFGIPAAHVPAAVATAVAALVAFYVARGDVSWDTRDGDVVRNALVSATTGYVLMPFAAVFAAIAWWLRRTDRDESSLMYGIVTAATAAASLGLAVWFGFGRAGDPHNITWLLAIYAIGTLAVGLVLGHFMVTRVGSALLLAALVQCIVFRYGATWQLAQPWVTALLTHATVTSVFCAALSPLLLGRLHDGSAVAAAKLGDVRRALAWSALVTSSAGAAWTIATVPVTSASVVAIHLAWIAAVWVLLAVLRRAPSVFTAAQFAAVLAIVYAAVSAVESHPWYAESPRPWLDPWFLEIVGIALAAYCALAGVARWLVARARDGEESVIDQAGPHWSVEAAQLLNPNWPAVDHVLQVALVLLVTAISVYAAAPGVAQELSPVEVAGARVVPPVTQFEIPAVPHVHAAGGWAWLLLAAVAAALASELWQRANRWQVVGLTVVAMAMCPLIAARWEMDVAVTSALRWVSAAFFALGSVAVWLLNSRSSDRASVDSGVVQEGTMSLALESMPLTRLVRDLLVAFVVFVYMALGTYVVQAALLRPDVSADVQELWPWVLVWAFVLGVGALLMPYLVLIQLDAGRKGARAAGWTRSVRDVLLVLAAAPVVILVTFGVASVLDRHPIVGPEPDAWFRRIGWDVSYGVPIALIAIIFVGHAIRDRSSRFAFAAGALFNAVATMVVLMRLARGGGTLDAAAWIRVAQVNAIVAALVAIVWQGAVWWYSRRGTDAVGADSEERFGGGRLGETPLSVRSLSQLPALLVTQVALAVALCGMFLAPAVADLVVDMPPASWAVEADGAAGWLAVLLASAAAIALQWRRRVGDVAAGAFVAGLLAIVSLTVARTDNGGWQAYHTLLVGACVAACSLPGVTWFANRLVGDRSASEDHIGLRWSAVAARLFGIVAVLLAFGAWENDPQSPWWTIAVLLAISLRNVWIAWYEGRRGAMWIASMLLAPAVSIAWIEWSDKFSATNGFGEALEFVWVNVLATAAMAVVSAMIERRRAALYPEEAAKRRGIGFHRFAAWAIVALLMLTTGIGLAADYAGDSIAFNGVIAWSACAAGLIAAFACSWDPGVRWSVACLYCVGLIAVGIYLDGLNLTSPMFEWALANALAAYSLATSALWSVRDRVRSTLARLGVPVDEAAQPSFDTLRTEQADEYASETQRPFARAAATWEGSGHAWLVPVNILIGVFVLLLVTVVQLTDESFTQRMVSAYAIGAQAFAIGLLARGGVRTPLQYTALGWGVLFAVAFGWAWVPPSFPEPLLHRLIVSMAALAAVVIVYGFGLVKFLKRDNEWTRAAARLVPPLAGLAVILVLVVVAVEGLAFVERGQVQVAVPAMTVVGAALACLIVAALSAALLPGRDPLGLSEHGRTVYVYAAEALAALLFLHIRVTMPWLFRGWFLRFWPLVVMAIAFVGVGLGEAFQRRRQRVLSEPLQTTGALLPLLPALGFWIMSSQVHYSLLLLSIGVLYASMSVLRGSFVYGVLAAIAANGSLWYLLHDAQGLSFVEHPQLWLIPPALCALVAGYINRARLTAQQSAGLRYAAAIVIYVSSTADVFINGVANAPWLPAVLAGISIVGVLAGILLRVRAFLYLGTAFLVVAIMTIIWHAAIHQQRTYILWIAGIVTGALIIAMFGLFEKRRDDVLRVVEELKHWHA